MHAASLLLVLACQDPAPRPAAGSLDVVELENGDELHGRVTVDVDGYVEVQLEAGAVVGLARAQVRAIRRGAVAAPAAAAVVPSRNEWFVLHDAAGRAVGWLHSSVAPRRDGGFTVSEEYEFADGARRYQITTMAVADAAGQAASSYFRERISAPLLGTLPPAAVDVAGQAERVLEERIVEATCRGDRLQVMRLDRDGRRERELPWPHGATFPLLARALARTTGSAAGPATMFDPAGEELVVRGFDAGRRRTVVVDGAPLLVTELAETTPTGRNAEWLDASSRTVRRELAGPALVAVPSNADSARFAVGAATIPGAVAAEAGGGFGLWLPNPAWLAREGLPPGQVALSFPAHGASARLLRLDHLEPGTPLDTAADAVAKWFALLQPELAWTGRNPVVVRDRAAVQLLAAGGRGAAAGRASVDVIPHHGHFLVLVCQAPAAAWDELAGDFEFLRRTVEFEPQSLAPTLQGPLAARAGTAAPRRVQANVPPAAATPPAAPAPGPVVRIPE